VKRCPVSVLIAVLVMRSTLTAQALNLQMTDRALFNDRPAVGPGVLDDELVYCYWPKRVVIESAMTAVDLATGRLVWSRATNLALPAACRIEEGWLQYETSSGDAVNSRRTLGPRTFHLVEGKTGAERVFAFEPERHAKVERSLVHANCCLTPQGVVVRCSDGEVLGDLGKGEHHAVAQDGELFVASLVSDDSNTHFEKRILRRFELSTMRVLRQLELPLEVAWRVIAGRGDFVVGRTDLTEQGPELICYDLARQVEVWRSTFPKALNGSPSEWQGESVLRLTMGVHGIVRPVQINLENGVLSPEVGWQDPRLLLAWHQESGQYPDFVATNQKYFIGRWRYLHLACVNSETGQMIWSHDNSNHIVGRMFTRDTSLGDYLVAEASDGLNIVCVSTGERRAVLPSDVGLVASPKELFPEDAEPGMLAAHLLRVASHEWFSERMLLAVPLLPLFCWLVLLLIRGRSPFRSNRGDLI
jgi:outer membrane protein assembly factor BamB